MGKGLSNRFKPAWRKAPKPLSPRPQKIRGLPKGSIRPPKAKG
jgi:hypothetical protein